MTNHIALKSGDMIGIIGGGQLGRMLCMAAARLGFKTMVLDPSKDCPAAQLAYVHLPAAYDDWQSLEEMSRQCMVITYEFENIPVSAVKRLERLIRVSPSSMALENSQDRMIEKNFINSLGIRTAPFAAVGSINELFAAIERIGAEGILKTNRLGYDGKGQVRLRAGMTDRELVNAYESVGSNACIFEGFIAFEREISIIAARSMDGVFKAYDPAENVHSNGILHSSTVPANVSSKTRETSVEAAKKILAALDYVGVMGVEFFVLADGSLIVNEIAPRVHNSGHWTEAACVISQFEQHIRAIAGLALVDPHRHSNCIMENLIGNDVERFHELQQESGTAIHLYGKSETRDGRKMGHFTRLTGAKG